MQLSTEQGGKYSSVAGGLRSIWVDGGLRGFFQGNGLNCAKIMPESATRFFVYENLKYIMSMHSSGTTKDLSIGQRFVAGSIAGALSQVF